MRNGNGGGPGIEDLIEALSSRQRLTPEQEREKARAAFNERLAHALEGACPGNEDPRHKAVEEAASALILATRTGKELLPSSVEAAICKVIAFEAMHHEGGLGEGMKVMMAPDMLLMATLVAGATLRVKDLPAQSAKDPSTGLYI